jgi:hypothetical protein
MSAAAWELVSFIEANGGQIEVDGEELVICPGEVALPVLETIRTHKGEIIALLQNRNANPVNDLLDGEWMLERCVYRDRWWEGVGCLHLDLANWLAERGKLFSASRREFVIALQSEGFQVTSDGGLVYGLVFKEDILRFHDRPAPSKKRVSRKTPYTTPYTLPEKVS